jgi:hypothetical protein
LLVKNNWIGFGVILIFGNIANISLIDLISVFCGFENDSFPHWPQT